MKDLCEQFRITRKTGYKLLRRYEAEGVDGLRDRSRVPLKRPNQLSPKPEGLILRARRVHPTWGSKRCCSARSARSRDAPSAFTARPASSHLSSCAAQDTRCTRCTDDAFASTKPAGEPKTAGARHIQLLDERAALRLRGGSLRSPRRSRKAACRQRAKRRLVSSYELQNERYAGGTTTLGKSHV